jgi:hypothetical protein
MIVRDQTLIRTINNQELKINDVKYIKCGFKDIIAPFCNYTKINKLTNIKCIIWLHRI